MQDSLPAGGLRLYREGVEPSGSLRKVSDQFFILLSRACPVASRIFPKEHASVMAPWSSSPVSTSAMSGAPRERAPHSAVASAAPPVRFRCRRRRFLASVRGRRAAATPCCQRKRRAYLMTRDQTRAPVTCVRTALPAPSSRRRDLGHDVPLNAVKLFPFSPSSRQALLTPRGAPPPSNGTPFRQSTCDA
jgi:hypothetical protein